MGPASNNEKVRSLDELYQDRQLYSSSDMFSPPSERLAHAIRFELTSGCDWGKCTFCNGFDGTPFREKTLEEYKHHVDSVWERVGERSILARGLTRFFIGGGNAMAVETKKLAKVIDYTAQAFKNNTRNYPRRIAVYASIKAIAEKEIEEFCRIQNAGLNMAYIGLESGSEKVLRYVNKSCTQEQLETAIERIYDTSLPTSIMIMPGLGGVKFADEHVKQTIEVLKKFRPKYITFMGVNPCTNSRYAQIMAEERRNRTNRPLRDSELIQQMTEIILGLGEDYRVPIGCFNRDIDSVGYNPAPFGSVKNDYNLALTVEKLRIKTKIRKTMETITDLFK